MLETARLRRQLSRQRRLRDELLLDLGALVYELHRQGRRAPELLQQKAGELGEVDDEVRRLEAALDGREEPIPRADEETTSEWDAEAEPDDAAGAEAGAVAGPGGAEAEEPQR